jgi:hypothetical protein
MGTAQGDNNQSTVKRKTPRDEVSCARCVFTKYWTQKQWDRHMLEVHNIKNEQKIV